MNESGRASGQLQKPLLEVTLKATVVPMPKWVVWCAWGAFAAALPSIVWRLMLAAGNSLGTPASWRSAQDIPGAGAWYLLVLSALQLAAAACSFALVLDIQRFTPKWVPTRAYVAGQVIAGIAGIAGALALTVIIGMSVVAWDKVDPFSGQAYDLWAWLCFSCYLSTVFWPLFLGAATVGCLRNACRRRKAWRRRYDNQLISATGIHCEMSAGRTQR